MLTWIWAFFNISFGKTLLCFLTSLFVPLVGFIWAILLGASGNRWAWREKRWSSVGHFRNTQRKWSWAGLIVWVVIIAFVVLLVLIGAGTGGSSGSDSNVLFEDDFSNTSSGWRRKNDEDLTAK